MPSPQLFGLRQVADQGANLITELRVPIPAVLNGNTVVAGVSYGTTARVITVTDDQGNTYTRRSDVTRGQEHEVWSCANVTNAPTLVKIQVDSTGSAYLTGWAGQICGVGAFDTSKTSSGSSTTPNTGSVTPTSGAFMVFSGLQDSSATFLDSWTPDSGWQAHIAELSFVFTYVQTKTHTSGAITPGCTMSASRGWSAAMVSFVVDSGQGTAPPTTGGFADGWHDSSFKSGSSSPWKVQCPITPYTSGILVAFEVAPGIAITGITDTAGNSYSQVVTKTNGSGGTVEAWKASGVTGGSTNILTITFTGSTADNFVSTLRLGAVSPTNIVTETPQTSSGSDATAGTHTLAAVSYTPGSSNGIIIRQIGVQSKTITAISAGVFQAATTTPTIASPAPLMQNNGYATKYAPSGTDAPDWTIDGAANAWEQYAIFIDGASPGVTVNATGVSGTGNVGTLAPTGGATISPSGLAGTGATGTIAPTGNASISATGLGATGNLGSVAVVSDGNATVSPTGIAASGAVGSPAVAGGAAILTSGVSASGALGTLAPTGGAIISPSGISSTGIPGSVVVDVGGNVTVNATGVSASSNLGTISVVGGAVISPTGIGVTGRVGSVAVPQAAQALSFSSIELEARIRATRITIQ